MGPVSCTPNPFPVVCGLPTGYVPGNRGLQFYPAARWEPVITRSETLTEVRKFLCQTDRDALVADGEHWETATHDDLERWQQRLKKEAQVWRGDQQRIDPFEQESSLAVVGLYAYVAKKIGLL